MTADADILYPSIVMALMTCGLILSLGIRRFVAVRRREVNPRLYVTFSTDDREPDSLRRLGRNVQNQFEVPPLFHLAVWGTYAAGDVTAVTVGMAWFFVASRVLHAFIHIAYNNVMHRFLVFGIGVFTVACLWIQLLLSLLA